MGAGLWVNAVAKGVIIPQGVAYCCLSHSDKTKPSRLGFIAVCSGTYSGA